MDQSNQKGTFERLDKVSEHAIPDFKKQIEEKDHQDAYLVKKLAKQAFGYVAFVLVLALGALGVLIIWTIGQLIYAHSINILSDKNQVQTFLSHTWSFIAGALACISIMSYRYRK